MKLTRKEKMLFFIPLALLALPFVMRSNWYANIAESFDTRGDGLDKAMRRLAGRDSIDCGHVSIRGSRNAADACSIVAFNAKKPFRVRYDLQGIDSAVSVGMVGTSQGQIYSFGYDSDPSGGSNVGERVGKYLCAHPTIVTVAGQQRIECK